MSILQMYAIIGPCNMMVDVFHRRLDVVEITGEFFPHALRDQYRQIENCRIGFRLKIICVAP